MKDQITALVEALRLSQLEIEKLRRKRQGLEATVGAVERILADPVVAAAIHNLEPFSASPSVVPEALQEDERANAWKLSCRTFPSRCCT